jgi:hypothetical protein
MTTSGLQPSKPARPALKRCVLAVDGHDGSGKTTLARRLAEVLGAVYERPFGGRAGKEFIEAAEGGQAADAIAIAKVAVAEALSRAGSAEIVVLDRCWMTVFSAIPDEYFGRWQHRIPTVLCWAALESTLMRLSQRRERQPTPEWHRYYLNRYADLGRQFDCLIVRTDEMDEHQALITTREWAHAIVRGEATI